METCETNAHTQDGAPDRVLTVLHIDAHPLYRLGMRALLESVTTESAEPRPLQLLEAATLDEALSLGQQHPNIELTLLEPHLTDCTGLHGIFSLRDLLPKSSFALLSGHLNDDLIRHARRLNVAGCISKDSPPAQLSAALRRLLDGHHYFPQQEEADSHSHHRLTPRQLEVLRLIAQGKPNKSISESLGLAQGTVRIHVSAILKALGVSNRTQAGMTALQMGLIGTMH